MVTCVSFVMAMQRRYVLCLRRPTSGRCTLGCVWMMCSVSERDCTGVVSCRCVTDMRRRCGVVPCLLCSSTIESQLGKITR